MCLIVAPDLDNIESKGGINDMVGNMINMAASTGEYGEKKPVPVFFVMDRWTLGKAILRKVPIACVAVLNYQGSDENFKAMVEMLPRLKQDYVEKLNDAIHKINLDLSCTNNLIKDEDATKLKTDNGPTNGSYTPDPWCRKSNDTVISQ